VEGGESLPLFSFSSEPRTGRLNRGASSAPAGLQKQKRKKKGMWGRPDTQGSRPGLQYRRPFQGLWADDGAIRSNTCPPFFLAGLHTGRMTARVDQTHARPSSWRAYVLQPSAPSVDSMTGMSGLLTRPTPKQRACKHAPYAMHVESALFCVICGLPLTEAGR
jgi:hypothetical protein